MGILVVIPARKNSKGIPGKNLRILAGKALIQYCIETALSSEYSLEIAVTTDDEGIQFICKNYNIEVIRRPSELAGDDVTLDSVVYHAVNFYEHMRNTSFNTVITLQPTSPLLTPKTLDSAISCYFETQVSTLISVKNHPHLAWTKKDEKYMPLYEERKNRQWLPVHYIETGAFLITDRKNIQADNRIGQKVSVFEMPLNEAIDIDEMSDLWLCERYLTQKNILIRVEGYREIGLGHVYRCLTLAHQLMGSSIRFVISRQSDLAEQIICAHHYSYDIIESNNDLISLTDQYSSDVVINDILNTDREYIFQLKNKGIRVINFEDLGPGAYLADAVINELYEPNNQCTNFYWGYQYYILREQFLLARPKAFDHSVSNILITFGGTDPQHITRRIFEIIRKYFISPNIVYYFILGIGNNDFTKEEIQNTYDDSIILIEKANIMASYMEKADFAIASYGRTMMELAYMQVPSILIAENKRELNHRFGSEINGFIGLGLNEEITDELICKKIGQMIKNSNLRQHLKNCMSARADALKNVINLVKSIIYSIS